MCIPYRFHWQSLLGACLLLATVEGSGQTLLTFSDALHLAEKHSASLEASRHGAAAARQAAIAAGQLPDPSLRVGLDNLPVTGPDRLSVTEDFMTMRRLGVMQEYVSQEKRAARRLVGEREAEREESAALAERAVIRREVATAWFDAHIAARGLTLIQGLRAEAQLQLDTFHSQVRAGKAPPIDLPMLQATALQVDDRVKAAEADREAGLLSLRRWVGEDVVVAAGGAPDIKMLPTVQLVAEVETPRQRLARQLQTSAEAELALSRLNKRPNWSWEVSYAQRGPAFSNMVSVGVSVPLPLFPEQRQERDIAAKHARVAEAAARAEEVRRAQQVEVQRLMLQWQSLLSRHDRLTEQLLPVSRTRTELALAGYRSGQQSLAQVLSARQAEVETQLQLLEHEREAARLWAQLAFQYLDSGDQAVNGEMHQ